MPWATQPLGSALTFQRGFDITKAEQHPGPYWVISSSGPSSKHSQYKVEGPGVIIGRKGSLGTVHFSAEDFWPHDTTLWVKDFHGNDPRFAYYFLQTMGFERLDVGAANPTLNRNHIHVIPVSWPTDAAEQRRIASILSAYDDLIENNTRRIAILEEMARRIYAEWFVRFRFPGHEGVRMVESELGLVPDRWSVVPLGSVADVQWGDTTITKKSYVPEGYTAYSAAGPDGLLPYADHSRTGIVLSAIGSCGTTWLATGSWSCIKNTIRFFSSNQERACDEFLFLATRSKSFWPTRGAAQPFISLGDARAQKLVVPSPNIMQSFCSLVRPQLALSASLDRQNRNLRATRDLLLPKLISGELDVSALPELEALAA